MANWGDPPHKFHPGFCCGHCEPVEFPMPQKVHSALIWSILARWDELEAQKRFVPNEPTRLDLKTASKWLTERGILQFDPLKDK